MAFDISNRAQVLAASVIGAVVVIIMVAALAPQFFSSLADVNAVFTNSSTTTGDSTADSLLTVFPILIGVAGLFAIVAIVLNAVKVNRGSR